MPQASIKINGVAASNDDLAAGSLVLLDNQGTGGETTFQWVMVDKPPTSAAALSNATIQNPTFTVDAEGTYKLQLTVNGIYSDAKIAAVRQLKTRTRVPAFTEQTEDGPIGWAGAVDQLLRLVDTLRADPGLIVGVASGVLAKGAVLVASGVATLKPGLPGQEVVPQFSAYGGAYPVTPTLWTALICEGGVDGNTSPPNGALIFARRFGLYSGTVTLAGAAIAGVTPVFVDTTGALNLDPTQSSFPRPVATVVSGVSPYRIFFDGRALDTDPTFEQVTITGNINAGLLIKSSVADIDANSQFKIEAATIQLDKAGALQSIQKSGGGALSLVTTTADPLILTTNGFNRWQVRSTGELAALGGNVAIQNVLDPVNPQDAATRSFVLNNAGAKMGNVAVVDAINGNDGTAAVGFLSRPFLTIGAALAAVVSGQEVWVLPGTYNITAGLTVPPFVSLRGLDHRRCMIQAFPGAVNFDVITISGGGNSLVENLSIFLEPTGHGGATFRGVVFLNGSATNSRVRNLFVLVDESFAGAGSSTATGIHSVAGDLPVSFVANVQDCLVSVVGTGTGTKTGVLLDTAAGQFNVAGTYVRAVGGTTSNGAAANIAGGVLKLISGTFEGGSSDATALAGAVLCSGGVEFVNGTQSGVTSDAINRQSAMTEVTVDTTTASQVFVALLSLSITTRPNAVVLIHFSFAASNNANHGVAFSLQVDGVTRRGAALNAVSTNANAGGGAIVYRVSGLAAGAHTIAVQWRTIAGGMAQIRPATQPDLEHAVLMVEEVSL
jgi:hypothetical protein